MERQECETLGAFSIATNIFYPYHSLHEITLHQHSLQLANQAAATRSATVPAHNWTRCTVVLTPVATPATFVLSTPTASVMKRVTPAAPSSALASKRSVCRVPVPGAPL